MQDSLASIFLRFFLLFLLPYFRSNLTVQSLSEFSRRQQHRSFVFRRSLRRCDFSKQWLLAQHLPNLLKYSCKVGKTILKLFNLTFASICECGKCHCCKFYRCLQVLLVFGKSRLLHILYMFYMIQLFSPNLPNAYQTSIKANTIFCSNGQTYIFANVITKANKLYSHLSKCSLIPKLLSNFHSLNLHASCHCLDLSKVTLT